MSIDSQVSLDWNGQVRQGLGLYGPSLGRTQNMGMGGMAPADPFQNIGMGDPYGRARAQLLDIGPHSRVHVTCTAMDCTSGPVIGESEFAPLDELDIRTLTRMIAEAEASIDKES